MSAAPDPLRWERKEREQRLYLGQLPQPVAWMQLRTRHWEGHLDLSSTALSRQYATREKMEALLESTTREWLRQAQLTTVAMPTGEAHLCHTLLDEAGIDRVGPGDSTLSLSRRIRLLRHRANKYRNTIRDAGLEDA